MAAAIRRRGKSGLHRAGCWREPGRGDLTDKCNREQTADGPGDRSQVRVKRCGKSAPAATVTSSARQTPPGARPSRGHGRPVRPEHLRVLRTPSGRPHRWMVTGCSHPQNPAYRSPHRCTPRRPGGLGRRDHQPCTLRAQLTHAVASSTTGQRLIRNRIPKSIAGSGVGGHSTLASGECPDGAALSRGALLSLFVDELLVQQHGHAGPHRGAYEHRAELEQDESSR